MPSSSLISTAKSCLVRLPRSTSPRPQSASFRTASPTRSPSRLGSAPSSPLLRSSSSPSTTSSFFPCAAPHPGSPSVLKRHASILAYNAAPWDGLHDNGTDQEQLCRSDRSLPQSQSHSEPSSASSSSASSSLESPAPSSPPLSPHSVPTSTSTSSSSSSSSSSSLAAAVATAPPSIATTGASDPQQQSPSPPKSTNASSHPSPGSSDGDHHKGQKQFQPSTPSPLSQTVDAKVHSASKPVAAQHASHSHQQPCSSGSERGVTSTTFLASNEARQILGLPSLLGKDPEMIASALPSSMNQRGNHTIHQSRPPLTDSEGSFEGMGENIPPLNSTEPSFAPQKVQNQAKAAAKSISQRYSPTPARNMDLTVQIMAQELAALYAEREEMQEKMEAAKRDLLEVAGMLRSGQLIENPNRVPSPEQHQHRDSNDKDNESQRPSDSADVSASVDIVKNQK